MNIAESSGNESETQLEGRVLVEKLIESGTLSGKSRDLIVRAMKRLRAGDTEGLDIVKLRDNLFRCNVGNYCIFSFYDQNGKIEIDDVKRRNEATYRGV